MASSKWRYITQEDREGPRNNELMVSTIDGKKRYALETSDIAHIQGYRYPGEYTTKTMYYTSDLAAASLKKYGKWHFENKVPEGREISGAKKREADAKQEKEQIAYEAARNKEIAKREASDPYFVAKGAEDLERLKVERLRSICKRYEAGSNSLPYKNKIDCIDRIMAAGYSVEKETKYVMKQKKVDDIAKAKRQAVDDRVKAKRKAENELDRAIKKRKNENALKREDLFAKGELKIEDLKVADLQRQLSKKGLDKTGGKAELMNRLQKAIEKEAELNFSLLVYETMTDTETDEN